MAEEHARAVARVAVGQIADVVGYDLAHGNALEAVADVMIRYIRELGTYAKEVAEYQGRTDVCVLDVVEGMQELDATCEEVASFLAREPRDPFSHTLAQFPVQLRALKAPSFKASHLPPPRHIPDHLPAFPDAHTMKFSPLYRKRATDARADYAELSTKRRSAQAALIGVHTKLQAAAKGAGAGVSADGARTNPFVGIEKVPEGPPLQLGPAEAAGTAERPGKGTHSFKEAFQETLRAEGDAAAAADAAAGGTKGNDVEMLNSDDEGAPPAAAVTATQWNTITLEGDALVPSHESLFKGGQIGFAMDPASRLDREAVRSRYAWAVEDAFQKSTTEGGRRRGSALDAERIKKRRAEAILSRGADAIDMDEQQAEADE